MTKKNKSDQTVRLKDANSDLFTDRLKLVIQELGGAAATARICGIAESTVRNWRDRKTEPQRPHLIPIAKGAGVSIAWLVAGELPMQPDDQAPSVRNKQEGYDATPSDTDNLAKVLTVVEEFLADNNLYLQPDKKAQLVSILFDEVKKEEGNIQKDKILKLVKLAV